LLENFGFQEIRLPVLERAELFARSIGVTTDIVEKEMYTFTDRRGELVTLRPEATASIVRAYIEHGMYAKDEQAKLYCIGPMFRYERPQKGRYRQFHQINAEVLGVADPLVDAEVLQLLALLFDELGLTNVEFQINSLGCHACRPVYRGRLIDYFQPYLGQVCADCRRRFELNPLRIMDCKQESRELLGSAPACIDHLCPACKDHFESLKGYLQALGVAYQVNPGLVRGLDYYTRTTFELVSTRLGAQNALAAGGRYDQLVKELGGPDLPGLGFAIGMERLVSLIAPPAEEGARPVFIIPLGERAKQEALKLAVSLGRAGISCQIGYGGKSLKSLMRRAQKLRSLWALIIGEEEMAKHSVTVKNMDKGDQQLVPWGELVRYLGKES
jgi:histidyl-tRNA synthetase